MSKCGSSTRHWIGEDMNWKKEIIKRIKDLSGSRSPYDIFCDWVKLMALSMQNECCMIQDDTWKLREDEYMKTITPYGEAGKVFPEMCGMLTLALDECLSDTLGEIYMESGCGNKNTGQFFTPFHVSEASAAMALAGMIEKESITLNEPSCGGGGMIIAAAKILKEKGINPQRVLKIVAQDLDWKAVYMCYVQLSLLGLDAVVVQGDTLAEPDWRARPKECIFRTPKNMGLLGR